MRESKELKEMTEYKIRYSNALRDIINVGIFKPYELTNLIYKLPIDMSGFRLFGWIKMKKMDGMEHNGT